MMAQKRIFASMCELYTFCHINMIRRHFSSKLKQPDTYQNTNPESNIMLKPST